ncbi:hypothetical protein, partial [Mesorhizobium sp. M3A.F.Ca.ET.174.01.1.1]|uniref:hypothetical protein n=1 Tax=Mesorhizobium sp. M3A.F.Ca.ET.174.01.1.1 TaxID=2563944 RepID=UPI001AEE0DF2
DLPPISSRVDASIAISEVFLGLVRGGHFSDGCWWRQQHVVQLCRPAILSALLHSEATSAADKIESFFDSIQLPLGSTIPPEGSNMASVKQRGGCRRKNHGSRDCRACLHRFPPGYSVSREQ